MWMIFSVGFIFFSFFIKDVLLFTLRQEYISGSFEHLSKARENTLKAPVSLSGAVEAAGAARAAARSATRTRGCCMMSGGSAH